ncbi:MAG: protein phosphatase 2C domain-containing protein, partial [Prevotella sp.]|nr:protein phosphatase 2C domain-containing protein [Prevotella sp.]
MKYKIKTYNIWHPGQRKDAEGNPHQEDSLFPLYNTATENDRLFILCDGMGGHEAGEVASATVCEAMSKSVLAATPDPEGDFSEAIFQKALADAYDALDGKDDGTAKKKMGTTMTFLKLHNKGCLIAHMGDSRVYHIRPGKHAEDTKIVFRTEDHSLVNDLVKIGELTPEEAKHSRQKNVITRAMQPHMERRCKADIHTTYDIAPGDYFYMCSDGMLENMEDDQLCYFFSEEAGTDENRVKSLLSATRENKDNHSAIIVHILDVEDPIKVDTESPAKAATDEEGPLVGEVHDGDVKTEITENTGMKSKTVPASPSVSASPNVAVPRNTAPSKKNTVTSRKIPIETSKNSDSKTRMWAITGLIVVLVIVGGFAYKVFMSKQKTSTEQTAPAKKVITKKSNSRGGGTKIIIVKPNTTNGAENTDNATTPGNNSVTGGSGTEVST